MGSALACQTLAHTFVPGPKGHNIDIGQLAVGNWRFHRTGTKLAVRVRVVEKNNRITSAVG
jgi:hypothetical protein